MYTKDTVNKRDLKGNTPLFYATNVDDVIQLIAIGANVNHENNKHETALFHAGFEKAKILIDSGADVNHVDEGYASPLFFSDLKTSKLLIEKGAIVDQSDMEGDTPLSVAASYKDVEKGKLLIDNGAYIHNVNLSTFSALELMPDELREFALNFENKQNLSLKEELEQITKNIEHSDIPERLPIPKF